MTDIIFGSSGSTTVNMLGLLTPVLTKQWSLFDINQGFVLPIALGKDSGFSFGVGTTLDAHFIASLTATLNIGTSLAALGYGLNVPDAVTSQIAGLGSPDWNTAGFSYDGSRSFGTTAALPSDSNFSVDLNYDIGAHISNTYVHTPLGSLHQSDFVSDPLGFDFNNNETPTKLFSIDGGQASESGSQTVSFIPDPTVHEDLHAVFSDGSSEDLSGNVGDDFKFADAPEGVGTITVTPTYTLSGAYESTIGVVLDGSVNISALKFDFSGAVDASFAAIEQTLATFASNPIHIATTDLAGQFAPVVGATVTIAYVKDCVGTATERDLDLGVSNQTSYVGAGGADKIKGNDFGDAVTTGAGNFTFTGGRATTRFISAAA